MLRLPRTARSIRRALLLCVAAAVSLFALSCGDKKETVLTDVVEDACAELGRKCHGVAGAEDCHDIGHQGNHAACRAVHSECVQRCENPGPESGGAGVRAPARRALEGGPESPSGGALNVGGAGGGSSTAGSAGNGGTGAGGSSGGVAGTGGSNAMAPECELLAANCGRVDAGSGAAHDCVLTGMSGDASACEAKPRPGPP